MSNKMKLFTVEYYGYAVMDKRFSKPMLPWIIAEIKRRNEAEQICVGVQQGMIHAYNLQLNAGQETLYRHPLNMITRFSHAYESHCTFMYLLRDVTESLSCHLYQAQRAEDVVELFTSMKEQTWKETSMAAPLNPRTSSNASQLTSLCADISPSSSHFFEVFYIGKIKVSHKKVPESFIDDALEKFKLHEAEKERTKPDSIAADGATIGAESNGTVIGAETNGAVLGATSTIGADTNGAAIGAESTYMEPSEASLVLNGTTGVVITLVQEEDENAVHLCEGSTVLSPTVEPHKLGGSSENLVTMEEQPVALQAGPVWMRNRAASTGSVRDAKKPDQVTPDHNRTMLFLVGRTDLRLISPDRKQILLHKNLRDVAKCIQGVRHPEHFGFICRESNLDCFIGYVFKCQSESFADDVVGAISQAFTSTLASRTPAFSCEHCPMVWYHKLCVEIEGLNDKRTQATIFRRLELLPDDEQNMIIAKFQGAELNTLREQNEFLVILLRAQCEAKQARHVHDSAENRSEFLNQYLGNSTIFMKAKRSLTSSFDQLLKRKGSRDDFGPILKELSLPSNSTLNKESPTSSASSLVDSESSHQLESSSTQQRTRKRSSTLGSLDGETMKRELHRQYPQPQSVNQSNSSSNSSVNNAGVKATPMMNIFMKVGSQPKLSVPPLLETTPESMKQQGSWRQAIYNKVVTPNKIIPDETKPAHKRDKEELRSLWKKAINQQLILIRMEKENARLTALEEEATVKRIKLEYDEISSCMRQVGEVWDLLISKESRVAAKCDQQMLLQAVKQGIPRSKRGDVWYFLAQQHCLHLGPVDTKHFPSYNTPYPTLLRQLTSHQHAILIDLGRTFPGHPYFSSPLGPGQLALFNLLKAYSLLDPEVGYCQGLSFIAGVLLLHVSEAEAFFLLRHLMCRRKLRARFSTDMAALQLSLYQLSRLLHDRLDVVEQHFDKHDVAPTLYAAPWLLTVFASQFPLGFVTRVFDLLFLDGPDVIFRVALALLSEHKEGLLACQNFEDIMDYLKTTLCNVDKITLDRVMREVFSMDISKQLREYQVEYQVLQEEMSNPRVEPEQLANLEREKQQLTNQNLALMQQLQNATNNVNRLEATRTTQQTAISRLDTQVRSLEISVAAMGNFVTRVCETHPDIELPGEIRRIITQLDLAFQRRASNVGPMRASKGVPLRVIQDTQHDMEPAVPRRVLKTALSSPNLSLKLANMSGFFNSSKSFLSPNDPALESRKMHSILDEGKIIKSNSDGSKVVILPQLRESFEKERSEPLRSSQSSHEIGAGSFQPAKQTSLPLKTQEVLLPVNTQETLLPFKTQDVLLPVKTQEASLPFKTQDALLPVKTQEASLQLKTPQQDAHPLDSCSDVSFTYGGTTKLKTIRPLRSNFGRNAEHKPEDKHSFDEDKSSTSCEETRDVGEVTSKRGETEVLRLDESKSLTAR